MKPFILAYRGKNLKPEWHEKWKKQVKKNYCCDNCGKIIHSRSGCLKKDVRIFAYEHEYDEFEWIGKNKGHKRTIHHGKNSLFCSKKCIDKYDKYLLTHYKETALRHRGLSNSRMYRMRCKLKFDYEVEKLAMERARDKTPQKEDEFFNHDYDVKERMVCGCYLRLRDLLMEIDESYYFDILDDTIPQFPFEEYFKIAAETKNNELTKLLLNMYDWPYQDPIFVGKPVIDCYIDNNNLAYGMYNY